MPEITLISKLKEHVKKGPLGQAYLLQGPDSYYVDKAEAILTEASLPPEQRDFNMTVTYGKETDVETVVSLCRQFPMMADRQVVVVRDAQNMTISDFFSTFLEAMPSTSLLVLCFREKLMDKRFKAYKVLMDKHYVFNAAKVSDGKLPAIVQEMALELGLQIPSQAAQLVAESIGNDLHRLENELLKVAVNKAPGEAITLEDVETYIGVSRDFNMFELGKAIGAGQASKAIRIGRYIAANPKSGNLIATIGNLTSFYAKIAIYHEVARLEPVVQARELGVPPFVVGEIASQLRHISMHRAKHALRVLAEYDLTAKGIGGSLSDEEAFGEMIYRLMA
jgi:DNA polymerase-3 subunit delta